MSEEEFRKKVVERLTNIVVILLIWYVLYCILAVMK